MLAQTDQERERYEARRKWQLDYNTGLKVARMEGELEGEARGELKGRIEGEISKIQFCERLLQRPETARDILAALPHEELAQMARTLEQELLKKS